MFRRLVLLISLVLALGLVGANAVLGAEIAIRVADGGDDAEQHLSNGSMDIGSSDLELPYENGGDPATEEQAIGLRFVNVPLGRGGLVSAAYVEFEVDAVNKVGSANPVNLIIEGELVPNAAPFAADPNNITDRALVTEAKVKWSIPPWTAVNEKFQTPDISSIIQEIVDQEEWVLGNAIVLILRDDKDNPSTGLREAESYDGGEASAAPLLQITGEVPIASDPHPADGATGVPYALPISTYVSDDVPKNIPDWNYSTTENVFRGVTSTLDVSDALTIRDLNVELDIRKPGNNADIDVYLVSPDGKQVELFTDVGLLANDDFKNTILDDEASVSITSGTGNFKGIYKPEGKLSDFDGRNTKGTWQLKVQDDYPGGPGTLNSWRIVIQSPILLSWTPGEGIASQDVYFSDSYDDVNDSAAAAFKGSLAPDVATLKVGPLELGQTYYWRIDEIGADGTIIHVGDIWSFTTAPGNVVIEKRIADEGDDAEEDLNPSKLGEIDRNSSDLEMPYEDRGMGDPQIIGVRHRDIPLQAGNSIVEAWVRFQVDEDKDGTLPVNLVIEGELSPNPDPFVAGGPGTFNISSRPRTETNVLWSVPNWSTVGDQGPDQTTSDITPIIEELIGQDGWAAGNAMVLIFSDDPCNPSEGIRGAEAGPGNDSALLHIVAITESAANPSPADGVVDVVQETVLSWSPGFTGVSRDVYFGTSSNPPKLERTTGISYDVGKLATSTTYYWKIDEFDAGGKKHAGVVWSFTTVIGEATNPYPADHAASVPVDVVLSWTPGATAVSHDGYFGTTSPPPFLGNTTENSFDTKDIGGLEMGTTYYWRLDAIEADGTKHVGDVWTFTTIVPNAGAKAEYYNGMDFEDLALARTDLLIDFNWGTGAPDPALGVDRFSVRWVAELVPAYSDTYTLWAQSDDGVRVWLDGELVIDSWVDQSATWNQSKAFELAAGESHLLQMEYYENGGDAVARLHWASPTQARRPVDALVIPRVALDPEPADGALLEQTWAMLSWTAGVTAASHNVYVSDNLDDVSKGAEGAFAGNQAGTILTVGLPGLPVPDGLVPGSTYYWRVDEVEADPNVVHEGMVWSFAVKPLIAHNPSPADGAIDVATDVQLSWTAGLGAKLHSVYFGDDLDTVTNATGAAPLPLTTFNPGPLEKGKTYYWRVDEFNPPTTATGQVWSFSTIAPEPEPEPEPAPEPAPEPEPAP